LRKRDEETVMTARNPRGNSARTPAGTSQIEPGEVGLPVDTTDSLNYLFSATYEELRRLASSVRRGDPSATLNPTALVNEAWMKMAKSPGIAATSPLHFKRIAARAMRQILIEAARRRHARKRGGGQDVTVSFDDSYQKAPSCGENLLRLDRALDELARMNPRQAALVESRFFGGMDIPETATLLNVSEATVLRDWRAAKAWLAHELRETS
jgi:RNA polymerase sigma-70 factor, ECF subfamily